MKKYYVNSFKSFFNYTQRKRKSPEEMNTEISQKAKEYLATQKSD
jgi:hypothetical protein